MGIFKSLLIKNKKISENDKLLILHNFDKVLSLDLLKFETRKLSSEDENLINELVEKRRIAKLNKNYEESDKIRDQLIGMGLEIADAKDGMTAWKIKE